MACICALLAPVAGRRAGLGLAFVFLAALRLGIALLDPGHAAGGRGPGPALDPVRLGAAPGRRLVETQAELRSAAIDGIQGLPELLVYGAEAAQAETHPGPERGPGGRSGPARRAPPPPPRGPSRWPPTWPYGASSGWRSP